MRDWIRCAGIRAIKTFAQALIATIPVGVMVTEVDWKMCLGVAVLAAILSLLTSLAGLPECDKTDHEWTTLERVGQLDEQAVMDENVEVEEEEL